jgi:hypothetical protein
MSDNVKRFGGEFVNARIEGPRVIAMDPQGAKAFFGFDDEPVDCGPPHDVERYKPGARVYVFPRKRKKVRL